MASEIPPNLKLLQLELEDIDLAFANPIDLRIPKFSDVMATDGDQYQEQRRGRNFRRWISHLEHEYKRLAKKTAVLKEEKQYSENRIVRYQTQHQNLIDKLWDRANPTPS